MKNNSDVNNYFERIDQLSPRHITLICLRQSQKIVNLIHFVKTVSTNRGDFKWIWFFLIKFSFNLIFNGIIVAFWNPLRCFW